MCLAVVCVKDALSQIQSHLSITSLDNGVYETLAIIRYLQKQCMSAE